MIRPLKIGFHLRLIFVESQWKALQRILADEGRPSTTHEMNLLLSSVVDDWLTERMIEHYAEKLDVADVELSVKSLLYDEPGMSP